MADCVYALTQHRWTEEKHLPSGGYFALPAGTIAAVDLRSIGALSVAAVESPAVFVAMDPAVSLDSTFAVLGRGDLRDLRPGSVERSAWESMAGFAPAGDTLNDWLVDHLLNGSDPSGDAACKPLMPTMQGVLEVHLFGHSRVWNRGFRFGSDPHTAKVRDTLQRDFEKLWEETQGDDHCRRVLDMLCVKHKTENWQEFVPSKLRSHIPGRLPHATTYTDNFNRSNGALGASWATWQAAGSAFSISSNTCLSNGEDRARYASSLSSSDNYAQANCTTTDLALLSRLSTSATSEATFTSYLVLLTGDIRTYKCVTGSLTQLASTSYSSSAGTLAQSRSSGSTISSWYAGTQRLSTTDTSISTGLAGGMMSTNSTVSLDNFETGDLATPSSSPSASVSSSPSTSVSATPSSSPSSSVSASPSVSASSSPSASPSASVSASPSASQSSSPSESSSPSSSVSASPSGTPSASVSASPSASVSASPSASVSASPSTSVSASPSASPSASVSASPSSTPSASVSSSPSASPSPSASVSASPSTSPSGEAAVITIEGNVFTRETGGVNVDANRLLKFQMSNSDNVVFTFEETEVS